MIHFLGLVLWMIGAVMVLPALLAPIFHEANLIPSFVIPAVIAIVVGYYIRKRTKPAELTLGKAMVMTTVAWIVFSAFSSVPYVLANGMSVEDAYFESMSGLTATGLTMIPMDPVADHLVISEVGILSGGTSYIEIYNPTDQPINLEIGGLKLWIIENSENQAPENIQWNNTTIQTHGYFLFASSSTVNGTAADATYGTALPASGAISITWGSDFFSSIDRVAWGGNENLGENGNIDSQLLTGYTFVRKISASLSVEDSTNSPWGNAYDTNSNAADFFVYQNYSDPDSSGVTKTPLKNIEKTSKTILFWRSLTEWVGGLGVIVLFLAALVGFGKAARKMYVAEARGQYIEPNVTRTARSLWTIYLTLTIIGIVLLYVTALPNASLFEATNHAMTGIATGGFSVRNDSFAGYGNAVLIAAIFIMLAGAISFAVHKRVFEGNWRVLVKNIEVKFMIALIVVTSLFLILSVGIADSFFQTSSAVTGTGFSSSNIAAWGDGQKGVLIVLMVIGGGYGSTSSALKLIRVLILGKAIYWMIKKSFLPERAVVPMKLGGRIYSEHEMMEAAIYSFIYLLVMLGGAVILMSLGNSAVNSIFESASAQGNVGLSVGITSTFMPIAGKITLIIQMLVGRLEIIPAIAFIAYLVAKVPRPSLFRSA